jgi:hypothetical protein
VSTADARPDDPLRALGVLVVEGAQPEALAAAALAVARTTAVDRKVAIFDLAGAFPASAGDGLVDALRDGRALNGLARRVGPPEREWFAVGRGPERPDAAVVTHARWPRLVAGIRSTGALLVILVPRELPGAETLMALADRAVSLPLEPGADASAGRAAPPAPPAPAHHAGPVAAAVEHAETEAAWEAEPAPEEDAGAEDDALPPIPLARSLAAPTEAAPPRRRRRIGRWILLALVLGGAGWGTRDRWMPVLTQQWTAWRAGAAGDSTRTDSLALASDSARPILPPPLPDSLALAPPPPDTLLLPAVVNPEDSARSVAWAVELVATNDRADANLRLVSAGAALSAASVVPVLTGGDATQLYLVVSGAFPDRAAAEQYRARLRGSGVLLPGEGVVTRLPFAIRLDTGLGPAVARARAREWTDRGVAAYPLLDDSSGVAAVYTGAFATPDQAVLLLTALRGAAPDAALAYRVGRTF